MKYRVCGKRQNTEVAKNMPALKPFFEVHVKLDHDSIILNPSLDEIQRAINKAATAVLRCSKYLYNWEQQDKNSENKASLYEMIA
jgi:dynein heavy chain